MIELANPKETAAFAQVIGKSAIAGDILILTGELGAGKTTLTKGIANGLGITQMIKSPTYTIIREYDEGRIPLYHMDIYRVAEGASDLGLDEYFEGDGLSVVEWGNLLEEMLPEDYLELILIKDELDEQKRFVKIITYGKKAQLFKERIEESWFAEND